MEVKCKFLYFGEDDQLRLYSSHTSVPATKIVWYYLYSAFKKWKVTLIRRSTILSQDAAILKT